MMSHTRRSPPMTDENSIRIDVETDYLEGESDP